MLQLLPVPLLMLLTTVRGQGVYAPANARIVHAGQACVVKDDHISERVYTIREGGTLVLVCLVTGHPRPQVKWTKTAGSASDRFQETTVFNQTLQITRILRVQGGRYYCKAENGIGGPAIKSIRVDVQYLDTPLVTVHRSVSDVRGENYYRERTVHLRCTVNSNPPAHFTWKRGQETITQKQDQGVDIYEPLYTQGETKILKLKDLRPQDYANFSCLVSVRNVCGIPDKATSFMLKNTTAPPVLSLSVADVLVVDPGADVEIECRVDVGDPVPIVWWTHSPGPMPTNARTEGGKLWIREIGTPQAGYYNCSARNGVGNEAKKSVEIRVRALTNGRFWITPDTFHDDEKIQLNREVKVSCQVEAVPQDELTYTWYKNGKPLRTSNRIIISRNDPEFQAGTSSLDIIDMRFSDSATYTCVASLQNQAVPDISLDVNISTNIVPPSLEVVQDSVQVAEGSLTELKCVVSGKPRPVVLWSRLDKEQKLGVPLPQLDGLDGTLRLENVSREMSGTYQCRTGQYNSLNVRAREGTIQLNVLYPPTVDPQYDDVRQRLGGAVTLICKMVSGNPLQTTSIVWTFNGNPLETPATGPELESVRQINRLTAKQYGIYQCVLGNIIGSETCLFNLSGRAYPPEFYYDTPNPVRIQKPNLYLFILQWTQRLPYAVGNVLQYRLHIQQEGGPGFWMGPQTIGVNRSLEVGSLLTYTVRGLQIPHSYTLQLTPITNYGPGDPAQRTIKYNPLSYPAPSGDLFCGFEGERLCGFTQDLSDDFDWTRENQLLQNPKNTPNTGPQRDTTGKETGYYMFIESSNPRKLGDRARLVSPLFNVTKKIRFGAKRSIPFCVNFYYHMYGKHIGSLNLLVQTPGTEPKMVWTLSGDQGERWQQANVTITPQGPFQVVLEGVRGPGYLGDIGLDDVSITKGPCVDRSIAEKDVIPRGLNIASMPISPSVSVLTVLSSHLLLR